MKRKITPAMKLQQEIIKRTGPYRKAGMSAKQAYEAAKKEVMSGGRKPNFSIGGVVSKIKTAVKTRKQKKAAEVVYPVRRKAARRVLKKYEAHKKAEARLATRKKKNPLTAFNVYLNGKRIDTVFFDSSFTAEEVKLSLISHDGYDPRIVVKKKGGKSNSQGIRKGMTILHGGCKGVVKGKAKGGFRISWSKGGRHLYDTIATASQIQRAR